MSEQARPEDLLARAKDQIAALAEARPRRRVDQACTECSKHHRKCERREGQASCNRCLKNGVQCIFTARSNAQQPFDPTERDSDVPRSPRSPTSPYIPTSNPHALAPPAQQSFPPSQVYGYPASYPPTQPVPSTSEIEHHHVPYPPTLVPSSYTTPSTPHSQYQYHSTGHPNVQSTYPQWQEREQMQHSTYPQTYVNQAAYTPPQQPPQPYANTWNPVTSSQYSHQPTQADYSRLMGGSNQAPGSTSYNRQQPM